MELNHLGLGNGRVFIHFSGSFFLLRYKLNYSEEDNPSSFPVKVNPLFKLKANSVVW